MASLPAAQSQSRNRLRSGGLVRWLGFGGAWIPTLMLAFIPVVLFTTAWPALPLFVVVLIVIVLGRVVVAISRRHAE
jgi:ABC-type phosphate transport system permease subunit